MLRRNTAAVTFRREKMMNPDMGKKNSAGRENLSADIFVVEFTLRCKEAEQPVWRV